MSERMVEMAEAAGINLEPWQRSVLARLPDEGPVSLDSRAAMRGDRRRFLDAAVLWDAVVAELTIELHDGVEQTVLIPRAPLVNVEAPEGWDR